SAASKNGSQTGFLPQSLGAKSAVVRTTRPCAWLTLFRRAFLKASAVSYLFEEIAIPGAQNQLVLVVCFENFVETHLFKLKSADDEKS
ncbi:MAG: hypothetical protein ABSG46_02600, partial [Candidatus Binataceae bacterium]